MVFLALLNTGGTFPLPNHIFDAFFSTFQSLLWHFPVDIFALSQATDISAQVFQSLLVPSKDNWELSIGYMSVCGVLPGTLQEVLTHFCAVINGYY